MGRSQEQLSMDFSQSRESISKQENAERRIQPGMTRQFIERYNNPWIALEAANEYIGWGITQLDGPAVDMHRSSVLMKLREEMEEAMQAMDKVKIINRPEFMQSFERQDLERSAQELADVIHAGTLFLATICETYNMSWQNIWEEHQVKIKSRGYVTS
ncbi:XRE family transcriptional regulator [Halobacillus salinus]|uniref:XRE family transcriptional regulator n=1 Tax=Halobacillus salinus TaxID=192814 RepID=UPI0020CA51A9|nr:XRE family transcriptional regulator [Halobacillus salinus]